MYGTDKDLFLAEPQCDNMERTLDLESEDFKFQPYLAPALRRRLTRSPSLLEGKLLESRDHI